MTQNSRNLVTIFQNVTQALSENQQTLNQSDTYNQNHGDNMVQTFQTITQAVAQKKNCTNSTALAYAAEQLAKSTNSTSGKMYAENLNRAAAQFKGRQVDGNDAVSLLQTLIGAQSAGGGDMLGSLLGSLTGGGAEAQAAAPAAGGDLLGSLLGGLTGQAAPAESPANTGGDLLGSLLGSMTGGTDAQGGSSQGQPGFDLLSAGMAFLQAKQGGQDNAQALIQALTAASGMGSAKHRTESTQVVVNAFLQALTSAGKK